MLCSTWAALLGLGGQRARGGLRGPGGLLGSSSPSFSVPVCGPRNTWTGMETAGSRKSPQKSPAGPRAATSAVPPATVALSACLPLPARPPGLVALTLTLILSLSGSLSGICFVCSLPQLSCWSCPGQLRCTAPGGALSPDRLSLSASLSLTLSDVRPLPYCVSPSLSSLLFPSPGVCVHVCMPVCVCTFSHPHTDTHSPCPSVH